MSKIDYTKKQATIITADKDIVDSLLLRNTNNRILRKSVKEWIKKAIEKKDFVLTGQGIAVSSDGILIDGQHRLQAIREAGYPPVELLVVTGLDPKAMMYIDAHAKRTTGDMLKIVLDRNITNREASIVNSHLKIGENGTSEFVFNKGRPSPQDIVDFMDHNKEFLSLLTSAGGSMLRSGAYCALLHYGFQYDKDRAVELAAKINTGEHLSRNDPAYKMREMVLSSHRKTTYGSAGQLADYKYAITVCVADALGEEISILRQASSWDRLPKKEKSRFLRPASAVASAVVRA